MRKINGDIILTVRLKPEQFQILRDLSIKYGRSQADTLRLLLSAAGAAFQIEQASQPAKPESGGVS